MINSYSIWLLQASFGTGMLAVIYELLLRKLTFFNLNRIFLVAGLITSLIIPVLPLPGFAHVFAEDWQPEFNLIIDQYPPFDISPEIPTGFNADQSSEIDFMTIVKTLLLSVYTAGAVRKVFRLVSALMSVFELRKRSRLIAQTGDVRIFMQSALPTFSFGNNIFLHEHIEQLNAYEKEYVLQHEKTHIRQKHTVDIILYELVGIVFWFHPAMKYLSAALKELHEFLVDSHVAPSTKHITQYGLLLVKLAAQPQSVSIVNSFSNTSTMNRIEMLTQPKSRPMQKLKFLATIPVGIMLFTACSFMQPNEHPAIGKTSGSNQNSPSEQNSLRIGQITWKGNSKFTAAELTDMLGVKPGDIYDSTKIYDRIWTYGDDGIAARYMNDGHLFFRMDVSDSAVQNKVNLIFEVNEGQKARVGKLTVKGNQKISTAHVLNMIGIKEGESFNRSKLILAQKALAESGYFDAKNININPMPDHASFAKNTVGKADFEFTVREI